MPRRRTEPDSRVPTELTCQFMVLIGCRPPVARQNVPSGSGHDFGCSCSVSQHFARSNSRARGQRSQLTDTRVSHGVSATFRGRNGAAPFVSQVGPDAGRWTRPNAALRSWLEPGTSSRSAATTRQNRATSSPAAGVARGTFYLYFEDKRGVFVELVDRFLARLHLAILRIDPQDPARSGGRPDSREHPAGPHAFLARPRDDQDPAHRCARARRRLRSQAAGGLRRCARRCSPRASPRGKRSASSARGRHQVFAYLAVGAIKELLYQSVRRDIGEESAERLTVRGFRILVSRLSFPLISPKVGFKSGLSVPTLPETDHAQAHSHRSGHPFGRRRTLPRQAHHRRAVHRRSRHLP